MKKAAVVLVSILALSMVCMVVAPVLAARFFGDYIYTVIVEDADGNPKANLWVMMTAYNRDGSPEAQSTGWVKTGTDGKVSLNSGATRYRLLRVGYLLAEPTDLPTENNPDMVMYDGHAPTRTITVHYPGTSWP